MRKIKNVMIFVLVVITTLSTVISHVSAKTFNNTSVKLDKLTVDIPYASKDITMDRSIVGEKTIVTIKDLNGKNIMTLKEYRDPNERVSTRSCGQDQTIIIETDFDVKGETIICRSRCIVYTECLSIGTKSYLRRIESADQVLASSSAYELRNTDTAINSDRVRCVGILEITKNHAISIGLSPAFLKKLGFSIEYTNSRNWIARYRYNEYITVRI